jgi:hypothetical protein
MTTAHTQLVITARTGPSARPQRVRLSHVEWVSQRMAARDFAILETVNRLRLTTSRQLGRLYFSTLTTTGSRNAARGRALRRLIAWGVLTPLPRRIGGSGHGSTPLVLALDSTGRRLLAARQNGAGLTPQVRFPGPPGVRTVQHTLAVAELYTGLVEQTRGTDMELQTFEAEPACWWPDGLHGYLKPDALAVLRGQRRRDSWWIEMDMATESLATIRKKAQTYFDFLERGQLGPRRVMPWVIFATPDEKRVALITKLLESLPAMPAKLLRATTQARCAAYMTAVLKE